MTEDAASTSDARASRSTLADNAEVARGFRNAPVAAVLLAINVGVFAAQVGLAGRARYALGMPDGVLRWLGANASLWTISDSRFETLLTSAFLHASVLHLVVNMWVLWQVGPLLERAVGSARFFPLYLASAIVGSAGSAIWGRFFGQTVSVGASGALCGLIAAATVVGVRTEGFRGELTISMGRWLALIVLVGLVRQLNPMIAQIDNAAHISGALAGAVVACTWERGFSYAPRSQRTVLLASVALLVGAAGVVYVRNQTDPFLFLNVEERMRAADDAVRDGRCDEARTAMNRAMQMDPANGFLRAQAQQIERDCAAPMSAGVAPQPRSPTSSARSRDDAR